MEKIVSFSDGAVGKSAQEILDNSGKTAAFGVDLGTTNSGISVVARGNKVTNIVLTSGKTTMPSCVLWVGGDNYVVGDEAYQQRYKSNCAFSLKRYMQERIEFELEYKGEKKKITPILFSAKVLEGLAEKTGGLYGKIEDVIITVPAYFNQEGVSATEEAARLAGLNLLGILREPTSAALCYETGKSNVNKNVLIFDLGGGTFDVSLASIVTSEAKVDKAVVDLYGFDDEPDSNRGESSSEKIVRIIDVDGDVKLGGDDYDYELYKEYLLLLKEKYGITEDQLSFEKQKEITQRLEVKKKNGVKFTHIMFDTLKIDEKTVETEITFGPDLFERAFEPIYKRCYKIMMGVINKADLNDKPGSVVLVGGSTNNPILVEKLKRDLPSIRVDNALNPEESVAQGAAIHAKQVKFGDSGVQIFDIVPIPIGINTGDTVGVLIPKGSVLPISKTKTFTTIVDNQTRVSVEILQGISKVAEECNALGQLIIDGIKEEKAGKPNLSVTITINANGLMKCSCSIDGQVKELELSIVGLNKSSLASSENKAIGRWKSFANKLNDGPKQELLKLIGDYPQKVNRKEIVDYINSVKDLVSADGCK